MRPLKPNGRAYRFFKCVGCEKEQRAEAGKSKDGGVSRRCNACIKKGCEGTVVRSAQRIMMSNCPGCGQLRESRRLEARRPGFRCRGCKALSKSRLMLHWLLWRICSKAFFRQELRMIARSKGLTNSPVRSTAKRQKVDESPDA